MTLLEAIKAAADYNCTMPAKQTARGFRTAAERDANYLTPWRNGRPPMLRGDTDPILRRLLHRWRATRDRAAQPAVKGAAKIAQMGAVPDSSSQDERFNWLYLDAARQARHSFRSPPLFGTATSILRYMPWREQQRLREQGANPRLKAGVRYVPGKGPGQPGWMEFAPGGLPRKMPSGGWETVLAANDALVTGRTRPWFGPEAISYLPVVDMYLGELAKQQEAERAHLPWYKRWPTALGHWGGRQWTTFDPSEVTSLGRSLSHPGWPRQ